VILDKTDREGLWALDAGLSAFGFRLWALGSGISFHVLRSV
jgi:hypothetical protein